MNTLIVCLAHKNVDLLTFKLPLNYHHIGQSINNSCTSITPQVQHENILLKHFLKTHTIKARKASTTHNLHVDFITIIIWLFVERSINIDGYSIIKTVIIIIIIIKICCYVRTPRTCYGVVDTLSNDDDDDDNNALCTSMQYSEAFVIQML